MAVQGLPWRFEQLGGDKKVLTLDGAQAPWGRPRQKAVVRDKVTVRHAEVYYPGNPIPTRHLFGIKQEPWELNGRFADRQTGQPGFATQKTLFVKNFVADQQELLILWGSVLTARGFIEYFDPGREALHEIEWKMGLLIDTDDAMTANQVAKDTTTPQQSVSQINSALQAALFPLKDISTKPPKFPPSGSLSLLDSIDSLVSSINNVTGQLAAIASSMSSFEKGLSTEIKRFRGGINQLRTAVLTLRSTIEQAKQDTALFSATSGDSLKFWQTQSGIIAALQEALARSNDADRKAAIAERSKIKALVTAVAGDSWEKMATRVYGSPSRANDLRQANGIAPGSPPVPGATYIAPS